MTQFSLFGAEAARPSVDDLDGLMLAGAHWVRSAAGTRLSIVVADRWRADAIAAAFAEREVAGPDAVATAENGFTARTAFGSELAHPAARWIRGAVVSPPPAMALTAGGLRLWAVATGRPDDVGYLLGTADPDGVTHRVAGAQLARLGVAAVALSQRTGSRRPGWRVTSGRRLRRLVELVGPPPAGAGDAWPTALTTGVR